MNGGSITSFLVKPILYLLSFLSPRRDDSWVFTTDETGRFAENTKYLYLYVNEHHPDIRPIWISGDRETVTRLEANGYEAHRRDSWRGRYLVLRSKFVFLSHSLPFWEYTGGATVIQLWHGNALKTLGRDNEYDPSLPMWLYQKTVGKNWDEFAITNEGAPLLPFSSAHDIRAADSMVTGYPRNDTLFGTVEGETIGANSETYAEIESISEDATVISYLPTYRRAFGNQDGQVPGEDLLDLDSLDELLEAKDAFLLVKLHPNSSVDIDAERFDRVRVLPDEFDVYPSLKYVDVLVTDYSSIFFDYLLTDNPIVFYPYDLDSYREERGFYFGYEELTPGPITTTTNELHEAIERCLDDHDEYVDRRAFVRDLFYKHQNGKASNRVWEHVTETYVTGQ